MRAALLYALAWLAFALAHSLLARAPVKAALRPLLGRGYRLAYNAVAVMQVALLVWLGRTLFPEPGVALPGGVEAALRAVQVAGAGVMLAALGHYDLGRFVGWSDLRRTPPPPEALVTRGLHRWVRHPLYAGAFLVLWGGAVDRHGAWLAFWGSLYLAVGSRFEERDLIRVHGDAYRRYRARVPAFVPWKGRAI